jgi:hypothetical protein
LVLSAAVQASAQAKVNLGLVLPLGKKIEAPPLTILGNLQQTSLRAWFSTATFQFEKKRYALAGLVLACTPIKISAAIDNRVKLAGGVITTPEIGAKISASVGSQSFKPNVMWWPSDTHVLLAATPESDRKKAKLYLMDSLYVSVSPGRVRTGVNQGDFVISSALQVKVSDQTSEAMPDKERDRIKDAAAEFWKNNVVPRCDSPNDIAIKVGPIEVGKNNEVLQFIKNAWHDLTQGPGNGNEIVKVLRRVSDMRNKLDDTGKSLANDIGRLAQKTFPKSPEIAPLLIPLLSLPKLPEVPTFPSVKKPIPIPVPSVPKKPEDVVTQVLSPWHL